MDVIDSLIILFGFPLGSITLSLISGFLYHTVLYLTQVYNKLF
jgi:hypothetical protein